MSFLLFSIGRDPQSASEQRLLRQNPQNEQPKPPEQPQVPLVATDVTRSIMGTDKSVEMVKRADATFQEHERRANETALANLNRVGYQAQAMFDMVRANDHILSPTAIEASVKYRNEREFHPAGIHISYTNGNVQISPYNAAEKPEQARRRLFFLNQRLQRVDALLKAYPERVGGAVWNPRNSEREKIQREIDQLQHPMPDQQATAPSSAPAGQPQQPGAMPMYGVDVAAAPVAPGGPEQAGPQIDMKKWVKANPEAANVLETLPPNWQQEIARMIEGLNESEKVVLKDLGKKLRDHPAILQSNVFLFDEQGRLKSADDIARPMIEGGGSDDFFQHLSKEERALFQRLGDVGFNLDLQRPSGQDPERPTEAQRQSIDKLMDTYNNSKTDKEKTIAEGRLRMLFVDVEASVRDKKIQMLPEGGARLVAFIMGAIQVCSALFNKEGGESKKKEDEVKKGAEKKGEKPADSKKPAEEKLARTPDTSSEQLDRLRDANEIFRSLSMGMQNAFKDMLGENLKSLKLNMEGSEAGAVLHLSYLDGANTRINKEVEIPLRKEDLTQERTIRVSWSPSNGNLVQKYGAVAMKDIESALKKFV